MPAESVASSLGAAQERDISIFQERNQAPPGQSRTSNQAADLDRWDERGGGVRRRDVGIARDNTWRNLQHPAPGYTIPGCSSTP